MRAVMNLSITMLRLYLRDPLTVALSLALLVFLMVIFGLVMGEDAYQVNLPLAVLDQSEKGASGPLLAAIEEDDLLRLKWVESEAEIDEAIRRAEAIGGLVMSKSFTGESNARGSMSGLQLIHDDDSNRWIRLGEERLESIIGEITVVEETVPWMPREKKIAVVKNRPIDFIFPGVLAFAIMQACLMAGVSLLEARKLGVLRRLQVSPLGSLQIFGSFMIGRMLIVGVFIGVLVAVAVVGFQASVLAPWWQVAIAVGTGCATFLAMGAVVAMVAPTFEAANLIVQALNFPMSFLCGIFFSVEAMPAFLQWVPKVLPLTYLADTMRGLVTLGVPLTAHRDDLAMLVVFALLSIGICAMSFRSWQEDGA